MKDELIQAFEPQHKIALSIVDCTTAAGELARAHLSASTASTYLAQALAGVALLGAETAQAEETVSFRLDCAGPLGGLLVECTAAGTLRGYTKHKILNDFDGAAPSDAHVLGATGTVEVIRSVPGEILSSGSTAVAFADVPGPKLPKAFGHGYVTRALDAYFAQSLQRRVRTLLLGAAGDDGVPTCARGILVECAPDGDTAAFDCVAACLDAGTAAKALANALVAPRTLLTKLALAHAEIRATKPIRFACRCSAERAAAMLAALPLSERANLPARVDITCHMCGRTWTVPRPN